jgi:hypothetical protein
MLSGTDFPVEVVGALELALETGYMTLQSHELLQKTQREFGLSLGLQDTAVVDVDLHEQPSLSLVELFQFGDAVVDGCALDGLEGDEMGVLH